MNKIIAAILLPAVLIIAGCPSQSQVAGLVQVLGNDAAAIAKLQGDPALADKLTTDTAAAVTAVTNWKSGTPSQEAVQALNIVIADLNLFPQASAYQAYIVLAVGTAQTIITLLQPAATTSISAHTAPKPAVVPTVKEFHKQCLALNIPDHSVCK